MSAVLPAADAPALTLFPIYESLGDMVARETDGLTDAQWEWTSPNWSWSGWSIRQNVSHAASHLFRHYLLSRNWGDALFPGRKPYWEDLHAMAALPHRYLDETRWRSIPEVLEKLEQALELVRDILTRETVASVRQKSIGQPADSFYAMIAHRYPGTLYPDPDRPGLWRTTLEGNFRHSEAEMATHFYNVQRLKRAQGLQSTVPLPWLGYWTLPGWDRSEA